MSDDEFKRRYFDQIQSSIDEVKMSLKENTTITTKLASAVEHQNTRVGKLENRMKYLSTKKKLLPVINEKVLTLLALSAVILMIVVAKVVGAGDVVIQLLS